MSQTSAHSARGLYQLDSETANSRNPAGQEPVLTECLGLPPRSGPRCGLAIFCPGHWTLVGEENRFKQVPGQEPGYGPIVSWFGHALPMVKLMRVKLILVDSLRPEAELVRRSDSIQQNKGRSALSHSPGP